MKNKELTGLLCALTATLCWACNYPVSRFMLGDGNTQIDEWFLSYLRIVIAIIFMLPFTFRGDDWSKFRFNWKRDWKMFVFLSFCSICEGVLAFVALKYTTAARASLMANTAPVFTLIISLAFAKESASGKKIIGMILGFCGILLVALSQGKDVFSSGLSTLGGDMLALISGIFWAVFTVFGGNVASKYSGVFCSVMFRLSGIFLMIPVMIAFNSKISFDFPPRVWLGTLYLGIISSGAAVGLWSYAQKYVKPGALGSFGYLSALMATIFSMIFLKEQITLSFVIAFAAILCGVFLMVKNRK